MPKPVKSWWCKRSKTYFVRLGPYSETTGKRKPLALRDEHGERIREDDRIGRLDAISRAMKTIEREEEMRRSPTVAEVCQAYVAWHRAEGSAARTVSDHVYHLNAFCDFDGGGGIPYGQRAAISIDVPDIDRLERAMMAKGNQSGYLKIRRASIAACWRWASRPIAGRDPIRLIPADPLKDLPRPRRGYGRNQALPWATTRVMIRRGWGMAKRHPYHRESDRDAERVKLIRTLYMALTAARPAEAARLRWDEILWDDRIARQEWSKTSKRTGKPRRHPLSTSLVKALARLQRWPGHHPTYVFLTAKTKKTAEPNANECADWFRKLRKALIAEGMQIPENATLYWMRHEFQSTGLESESAEGVAAVAGNSAKVLMSTYEHTENRRIREIGDRIDRARRGRGSSN
jgi:integrase